MKNNFTAIDFETAHGKRTSICQVGLAKYVNGQLVDTLSLLVQPPDNYYWEQFIDIHGITPHKTKNEPTFDKIWHQIAPFIENQNLVAHNGFRFDFPCLEQTLAHYGLQKPNYIGHCTYQLFGENLASLCQQYKILLNHHDALSDALACGELFKIHLNEK